MISHLQLSHSGIDALIARGLLDGGAADDRAQVRAAVVSLLNETLTSPPKPQPLKRAIKAFSIISLSL